VAITRRITTKVAGFRGSHENYGIIRRSFVH